MKKIEGKKKKEFGILVWGKKFEWRTIKIEMKELALLAVMQI